MTDRLHVLVDKLNHHLPEIRLRALRNLRQKLAVNLIAPSSFTDGDTSLYLSVLKLLSSSDRQEAYEALVLMEELCREGGDDAKKRFVEHGAFEALEKAGLSGEPLALASEVKESLLKLGHHAPLRQEPKACLEPDFNERGHVKRSQAEAEGSESRREARQQQPVEDIGSCLHSAPSNSCPSEPQQANIDSNSPPKGDEDSTSLDNGALLFDGWRPPYLLLSRADEKRIFEFQVRFGIRQDGASLLGCCRWLRQHLIPDFPAEIFLQRPQIVRQLLATVRIPRDDGGSPTPSSPAAPSNAICPAVVVLEALSTLRSLCLALLRSMRLHLQPSLKAPDRLQARSFSGQPLIGAGVPPRYPAPPGPVAPELCLSFPGFVFLVIDTLLPLAASEDVPSRIATRALAIIRVILPYLPSPTPCPSHHARIRHLLGALAAMLPSTPSRDASQHNRLLSLLMLDILRLTIPEALMAEAQGEVPGALVELVTHAVPHHHDLAPYLRALDPSGLDAQSFARQLVEDARPATALVEQISRPLVMTAVAESSQTGSGTHPASRLHPCLRRMISALPLLSYAPDPLLPGLGVHLWARSVLAPRLAFLDVPTELVEQEEDICTRVELAGQLLMGLLTSPVMVNRRLATQELEALLTGEGGTGAKDAAEAVLWHLGLKAAPLRGPTVTHCLLVAALSGDHGNALVRWLLEVGVRDEDDAVRSAAWAILHAVSEMMGEDGGRDLVAGWGQLLPLLVAARNEADIEERRAKDMGPGCKGLITRRLIDATQSVLPTSAPQLLVSSLLDYFSPLDDVRQEGLRWLHARLGPSVSPPCTLSVEEASAIPPEVLKPTAALSSLPFSVSDIPPLCDLLDNQSLEPTVRHAAAQQLELMLPGRSLPPALHDKVSGAVASLLHSGVKELESAGAELLMAAAWQSPELTLRHLEPFLPFLFHPSSRVRACVRVALVRPLFTRPSLWTNNHVSPGAPKRISVTLSPPAAPVDLLLPPSPSSRQSYPVLAFLFQCFKTCSRALLPVDPAVGALCVAQALRTSTSHKALSAALGRLLALTVSLPGFATEFLKVDWLHALDRVFQGPPSTRQDERLLHDALLALAALLPFMGRRDMMMLAAAAVDCLLPVLEAVVQENEAKGREARQGLVDELLSLLLGMCQAQAGSEAVRMLATRSPLASTLMGVLSDISSSPLSTSGLALRVLSTLLPCLDAAAQPRSSLLIKLASSLHHDPDSFVGADITLAALTCLRTLLSAPAEGKGGHFAWEQQEGAAVKPDALLRFISDRQTAVRALCYGCIGKALSSGDEVEGLFGRGRESEDGASGPGPSLFETALHVVGDTFEAPTVAAEAFAVVAEALQLQNGVVLSGTRVMTILEAVGRAVSPAAITTTGAHDRAAAGLSCLVVLVRVVRKRAEADTAKQDEVDEGFLWQLLWQQGLVEAAVRIVSDRPPLRCVFESAALASAGLSACQSGRPASTYFEAEARAEDAPRQKHQVTGWRELLEHAWAQEGGRQAAAAAQAEALRVLRLVVEAGYGDTLVAESSVLQAVVQCLDGNAQDRQTEEDAPVAPCELVTIDADEAESTEEACQGTCSGEALRKEQRKDAVSRCVLMEACVVLYELLRSCPRAVDELSAASGILETLLDALTRILEATDNVFADLQTQGLNVLALVLTTPRVRENAVADADPSARPSRLFAVLLHVFTKAYGQLFALSFRRPSPSGADTLLTDSGVEHRAAVAQALIALLECKHSSRQAAAQSGLIGSALRRLKDLCGALIVEDIGNTPDGVSGGSNTGKAMTMTQDKKTKTRRATLRDLNNRMTSAPSPSTSPPRATASPVVQDVILLLAVLRAALLECPESQQHADAADLPLVAVKLWPYAVSLEVSYARAKSASTPQGGVMGLDESMLEVLLGVLANFAAQNEDSKQSLLLTTSSRGRGAELARTNDTILHHVMKVAFKPITRVPVVNLATGFIGQLGLTSPGRKLLIQANFLSHPCGATVSKLLRGPGNRLVRPSDMLEETAVRVLAFIRLMRNLTLAAEGQKMLAQMPGFSDLLEDLVESLTLESREPQHDASFADDTYAELCYLLRNLSFLRGSKVRVLSAKPLLSLLVRGLTHPALKVRVPATVAVWSLLCHSQKSLAVLRSLVTPELLERAERMLKGDDEGKREGSTADEERCLMVTIVYRSLARIHALLSTAA